jgi:3-phenylpropionate/trans-cinnamate dioxygenase ferredoxin component
MALVRVCALSELADEEARAFEVSGAEGILIRSGDRLFACERYCTHEEFPLEFGQLSGTILRCTYHGAEFDLESGAVVSPPATRPLAIYPARVEAGDVLVEVDKL